MYVLGYLHTYILLRALSPEPCNRPWYLMVHVFMLPPCDETSNLVPVGMRKVPNLHTT